MGQELVLVIRVCRETYSNIAITWIVPRYLVLHRL